MNRLGISVAALLAAASAVRAEVVQLPDIDITVDAPGASRAASAPGSDFNVFDSTPANNTRISAAAIERAGTPDVANVLSSLVPSVDLQVVTGNEFQSDVVYRGFVASPVQGTPQGLAVYQNGVRINESFGDTVNWAFIPTFAIASMDLVSNNPAFGLNALGGALNIRMKDGFNFSGGKLDVSGGSYGRIQAGLEYGKQVDHFGLYIAIEGIHDNGFRQFSPTNITRVYGDLGYRNEGNEVHLSLGAASTNFGASGSVPVQLLQQDWSSVYTTPQTSNEQMGMATLSGKFQLSSTWNLNASAYVRRFVQKTVDGNPTNAQPCDDPTLLCFNDTTTPANGLNGQQLPNNFPPNAVLGEIDRSGVLTTGTGASLQLSNNDTLFGHANHFSFGSSFDFGSSNYTASAELGTVAPNFVVTGSGVYLGPSGNPVSDGPVNLNAINRYTGVYALDAFDISDKLVLSGGARLNLASISLFDELGGNLSGQHDYSRVNPLIGLTWKITPELQAYGSYAESNRAPTPLELGCANPLQPCILASFVVADPNLQQVVARTFEAGLRGQHTLPSDWGALGWKLGAYHTISNNDIMDVPSPFQQGFGYFTNVGSTLREGIEASVNYRKGPFDFHISYAYINATFLNAFSLASNSPSADANGLIYVTPGDRIPMIPANLVKLGGDWEITSRAKIGADLLFTGPQRFQGDASNQQPLLPSYVTVSLNGSYKVTDTLEFYGRVENLFDRRYYTYGSYFDTSSLFGNLTNPQSVSPAQPLSVYAGARLTF